MPRSINPKVCLRLPVIPSSPSLSKPFSRDFACRGTPSFHLCGIGCAVIKARKNLDFNDVTKRKRSSKRREKVIFNHLPSPSLSRLFVHYYRNIRNSVKIGETLKFRRFSVKDDLIQLSIRQRYRRAKKIFTRISCSYRVVTRLQANLIFLFIDEVLASILNPLNIND